MAGSIKLNENLTFGKTGRIREMDPHGFDLSEPSISWTKDETAGLTVIPTAVPPDASLRMTVGATPFIHPGHANRQQFFVFINGRYIGFKTLAVAEKINFTLPRSLCRRAACRSNSPYPPRRRR